MVLESPNLNIINRFHLHCILRYIIVAYTKPRKT